MAINRGVTPIDTSTLPGLVRLLVGDTDPAPLDPVEEGYGEYAWYSDEELDALGLLHDDSPKRVAIWVLSTVAINLGLRLRKWTSEDLQVDGPAIASGIEKTIARLSKEVERDEMKGEAMFDVVEPDAGGRAFWWGGSWA